MIGPYPLEPNYVYGGIESVLSTLAPALSNLPEIEHLYILSFNNISKVTISQKTEKLTIYRYPAQKKLKTITRSFLERRLISKIINEISPDIVHGQGIGLMGHLAISTFQNVVITVHGIPFNEVKSNLEKGFADSVMLSFSNDTIKQVLNKAKIVISTSNYDKNLLRDQVRGKHFLIPNPVDPIFFSQEQLENAEPYILCAGVMVRRKNLEGLLSAFSKIAEHAGVNLHLVGPQPDLSYKNEILSIIDQLDSPIRERVKLFGFISNAELADQIRYSTLVTLFSWEETRPTIISQAMASGKPIIASNVGGISDMVKHGNNGFLVSAGDVDGLASIIQALLDSRELRMEMGLRNYQVAKNEFDSKIVAQKTLDCYKLIYQ